MTAVPISLSEPVPVRVTRYRCPHCARSHSSKSRCRLHIARCWRNPDAKGCMTCKHFDVNWDGGEFCAVGVSLKGRPQCETCLGECFVWIGDEPDAQRKTCPDCEGRPDAVKPGPIVHCSLWEPSPEYAITSPRS